MGNAVSGMTSYVAKGFQAKSLEKSASPHEGSNAALATNPSLLLKSTSKARAPRTDLSALESLPSEIMKTVADKVNRGDKKNLLQVSLAMRDSLLERLPIGDSPVLLKTPDDLAAFNRLSEINPQAYTDVKKLVLGGPEFTNDDLNHLPSTLTALKLEFCPGITPVGLNALKIPFEFLEDPVKGLTVASPADLAALKALCKKNPAFSSEGIGLLALSGPLIRDADLKNLTISVEILRLQDCPQITKEGLAHLNTAALKMLDTIYKNSSQFEWGLSFSSYVQSISRTRPPGEETLQKFSPAVSNRPWREFVGW